jgi:hypothetical protein
MKVILYGEGTDEELDTLEVREYLAQRLGKAEIEVRGSPFSNLNQDNETDYAREFAGSKIQDAGSKLEAPFSPLYGEVEYEKRRLLGKTKSFGILYDGLHLCDVFLKCIPVEERRIGFAHIIFTNRLFATWDGINKRYHIRTSIYAIPSIISITGLVEAPAKPREYYFLKQQYENMKKDLSGLKDQFKGKFLDYGDERLTGIAKGYVMQAVFYSLTGTPFCEDKGCRLYNAHWQEELIFAQLESDYEFCPRHSGILVKLQGS